MKFIVFIKWDIWDVGPFGPGRDFELSRISSLFFSRLTIRDGIRSALKSRFTIRDGTEIVKSRTIAIFTKSQAVRKMCKG